MPDSAHSDNDDFDPDSGFVNKDENEEWKDEDKELMEQVRGCGSYEWAWYMISGCGTLQVLEEDSKTAGVPGECHTCGSLARMLLVVADHYTAAATKKTKQERIEEKKAKRRTAETKKLEEVCL